GNHTSVGKVISFRRAVGDRRAAGAVVPDSELIYLTAIRVHKRQRVAGNGITHACGYACNLIVRQPAAARAAQIRPDDPSSTVAISTDPSPLESITGVAPPGVTTKVVPLIAKEKPVLSS